MEYWGLKRFWENHQGNYCFPSSKPIPSPLISSPLPYHPIGVLLRFLTPSISQKNRNSLGCMSVSSYNTMPGSEMIPLPGSRYSSILLRAKEFRSPPMHELFAPRTRERSSISPDQALIHMIKVMMGTGMLSLPLAFKHSGLFVSNIRRERFDIDLFMEVFSSQNHIPLLSL